jgi:hypothetical protein
MADPLHHAPPSFARLRINDTQQSMGDAFGLVGSDFVGDDVEAAINLHRVRVDDFG